MYDSQGLSDLQDVLDTCQHQAIPLASSMITTD